MASIPSDTMRKLRIPGYIVMAMLTSLPIIELVATALPAQVHLSAWRLAVIGAAGGTAVTVLLGLFFIYAIAVASGDRGVLLFVSSICSLAAVLCLAAAGLFPLDALQMKAQVPAASLTRYGAASIVALLKMCFATVVSGAMAVSAYRAAAGNGRPEGARERVNSLVVGQPTARPNNS